MPSALASALSAEHTVTALQYNNLLDMSKVNVLPSGFNVFNSEGAPSTSIWIIPSGELPKIPDTHIGYPNAVDFTSLLHWGVLYFGLSGVQSSAYKMIAWRGNASNTASGYTGAGGWLQDNGRSWLTGTAATNMRFNPSPGSFTAIYGAPATAKWDMGAIYTGTFVLFHSQIAAQTAATASAVIAVSTDDITYTTIVQTGAAGLGVASDIEWTGFASADVVARYVRLLASITANVNPRTGEISRFQFGFFTASGIVDIPSGVRRVDVASAFPSGEAITFHQSAAPAITGLLVFTPGSMFY